MTEKELYIINLIKTKIRDKEPQAEVIIFGSHARGTANEDSDWDVLILLNTPKISMKTELSFIHLMFKIELEVGEPISTFVYSKVEWENRWTPLYENVMQEGIKL